MARLALLIAALLLGAGAPAQDDEPPLAETPFFRVHAPPELAGAVDFYVSELEAARRVISENWSIPLNEAVDVGLWTRESWDLLVDARPEMRDVLAYVTDGGRRIVINHAGCRRADPGRLRGTLAHEYVHVYIGRMIARWPRDAVRRRLPRWLEEGLAIQAAGEGQWWDATALQWRGPRRLMPLMNLAEGFPRDPSLQREAYRQSASAVAHLAEERGGLEGLFDQIADPAQGPLLAARAWDPTAIAGFEDGWHRSLRIGWRWLLIFTTGGFAWAVAMVVAGAAWVRRRRRAQAKVYQWAMEAEGLTVVGSDEDDPPRDSS